MTLESGGQKAEDDMVGLARGINNGIGQVKLDFGLTLPVDDLVQEHDGEASMVTLKGRTSSPRGIKPTTHCVHQTKRVAEAGGEGRGWVAACREEEGRPRGRRGMRREEREEEGRVDGHPASLVCLHGEGKPTKSLGSRTKLRTNSCRTRSKLEPEKPSSKRAVHEDASKGHLQLCRIEDLLESHSSAVTSKVGPNDS